MNRSHPAYLNGQLQAYVGRIRSALDDKWLSEEEKRAEIERCVASAERAIEEHTADVTQRLTQGVEL